MAVNAMHGLRLETSSRCNVILGYRMRDGRARAGGRTGAEWTHSAEEEEEEEEKAFISHAFEMDVCPHVSVCSGVRTISSHQGQSCEQTGLLRERRPLLAPTHAWDKVP